MKIGVCSICQEQNIPLSPVKPEVLGLMVKEGGFDNVEEMVELTGECRYTMAIHDGPHGQPCEGIGTMPQAVYDA